MLEVTHVFPPGPRCRRCAHPLCPCCPEPWCDVDHGLVVLEELDIGLVIEEMLDDTGLCCPDGCDVDPADFARWQDQCDRWNPYPTASVLLQAEGPFERSCAAG